MPSYTWLFRDRRGDDLVSYLENLQSAGTREETWTPSNAARAEANSGDGERLFHFYCATCHTSGGLTLKRWQTSFRRRPPDLRTGPFLHRREPVAKIVKFGISGTDMPGHEYLPDTDIASVSLWLTQSMDRH
jgi:cytochrome c oxidase cbb3-type subunit 2